MNTNENIIVRWKPISFSSVATLVFITEERIGLSSTNANDGCPSAGISQKSEWGPSWLRQRGCTEGGTGLSALTLTCFVIFTSRRSFRFIILQSNTSSKRQLWLSFARLKNKKYLPVHKKVDMYKMNKHKWELEDFHGPLSFIPEFGSELFLCQEMMGLHQFWSTLKNNVLHNLTQ